ncbi:MAG: tetratricopeptide repeat protein [Acidobacteriia bacterium]|nr:tetratricopeptide repeat protein [Terriglobia bacterium]
MALSVIGRLRAQRGTAGSPTAPAAIVIDYPEEGSVFPSEMTAPTFLWRDPFAGTAVWRIDFDFTDGSAPIRLKAAGEPFAIGDIDSRAVGETNELPKLTPRQAAQRTWKADDETWKTIKKRSVGHPATMTISGFPSGDLRPAVSLGRVTIETSPDPVGAPIFYRDVPLMPSELEKGVIKPLAENNVPLIAWRLRNLGEARSRLVLEGLHTCANCHSFSRDGKTLGMDVDGPENDKGTYAIVPVQPQMTIRNQDVITWNSFPQKPPGHHTIGFLSQISPDGQYAVTTLNESVYVSNFKDYRFLQVFYPTRGILAWYSRSSGRMEALPGADDPRYVHTDAVWSPDGKFLVFARAEAKDPYPAGRKLAEYANDPNEIPIQYDLYRIPFNAGKGGRPEPIAGASRNGMSNTFPKVSPDGRWIVFVECRNGQLMRPDSQLYIVPAQGGEARRMRSNTALMNSWHSFSPNGRWLVFSSKSRSPYTQMFLTHLDEDGRDTPPILIENATAANRAVNIPEFVNIPQDGLLSIDVPAAEFYRLFDSALELSAKGQYDAAIALWEQAVVISPDEPKAHNNLGVALIRKGDLDGAMAQFRKAIEIRPEYAEGHYNLGGALAQQGKVDEAIVQYQRTLEINPQYAEARDRLGGALAQKGMVAEAIAQFRQALEIDSRYAEAHNDLGAALLQTGRSAEAMAQFQNALEIDSKYAKAHYNLGVVLSRSGRIADALAHWRAALDANPDYLPALNQMAWVLATGPDASIRNGDEAVKLAERLIRQAGAPEPEGLNTLAAAYAESGRFREAAGTARRALGLAIQQGKPVLAEALKGRIALYESNAPYRESLPAR